MGIVVHIAIGLEEFVARDIGQQEMAIIKHAHKTRLAPFRRGITMAILVTGGHHHKWRLTDKLLNVGCHVIHDFSRRPALRCTELLLKTVCGLGCGSHRGSLLLRHIGLCQYHRGVQSQPSLRHFV